MFILVKYEVKLSEKMMQESIPGKIEKHELISFVQETRLWYSALCYELWFAPLGSIEQIHPVSLLGKHIKPLGSCFNSSFVYWYRISYLGQEHQILFSLTFPLTHCLLLRISEVEVLSHKTQSQNSWSIWILWGKQGIFWNKSLSQWRIFSGLTQPLNVSADWIP